MLLIYLFTFLLGILYTNAEFEKMESTESWELNFSKSIKDCSYEGKAKRFPELYNTTADDTELGPPLNFTVTYIEKPYMPISENYFFPGMELKIHPPDEDPLSTRCKDAELCPPLNFTVTYIEKRYIHISENYFFPDMELNIHPPEEGVENLRGYEIEISWKSNFACIVYIMTESADLSEEITTEIFPATAMMSFWFALTSLPPYNEDQSLEPVQAVTNFEYYRDPYSFLPEPADWHSPRIVYDVISCNGSRCVQIIFGRPPPEYGFQRYQIALVPVEDYINVRSDITTQFYHEFLDVEPGHYKITVKTVDDFFSQPGRCLCHDNWSCTNCMASETAIFVVE